MNIYQIQDDFENYQSILTTTSDDFSEIEKLNYQRLPKEKIKKLDGHYMLIELSKEEMKLLLYIDFQ